MYYMLEPNIESYKSAKEIWDSAGEHSAPIEGTMYDVALLYEGNQTYLVKRLKDNLAKLKPGYYSNLTNEEIFSIHQAEYLKFVEVLPEFVLPTVFIDDGENYITIQKYIAPGLQYKDAMRSGKIPKESQLPDKSLINKFFSGIENLVSQNPKLLPDLDFFITRIETLNEVTIIIFDTSGFWFEKRDGKDLSKMIYDLRSFFSAKKS